MPYFCGPYGCPLVPGGPYQDKNLPTQGFLEDRLQYNGYPTYTGGREHLVFADPTTGFTKIKWDFTKSLPQGCVITSLVFTAGAQVYVVPANLRQSGEYTFPVALADGLMITVAMSTNCCGTTAVVPVNTAFISYTSDACAPKFTQLPKEFPNWSMLVCNLCPCDCGFPITVTLDGTDIGTFESDGDFHPNVDAPPFTTGYIRIPRGGFGSTCYDYTRLDIGFTPGLAVDAVLTATINSVVYNFAPQACIGNAPIVPNCVPGGGGGGGAITVSGTAPINVTQNGNNYNVSLDQLFIDQVDQNTTDITTINSTLANANDFTANYVVADWVLNGGEYWLTINHGRGYPNGTAQDIEVYTSGGASFNGVLDTDFPNGNTAIIKVVAVPDGRADVQVVVEKYNL